MVNFDDFIQCCVVIQVGFVHVTSQCMFLILWFKGSLSTNVHCVPRYLQAATFCATDLVKLLLSIYLTKS